MDMSAGRPDRIPNGYWVVMKAPGGRQFFAVCISHFGAAPTWWQRVRMRLQGWSYLP